MWYYQCLIQRFDHLKLLVFNCVLSITYKSIGFTQLSIDVRKKKTMVSQCFPQKCVKKHWCYRVFHRCTSKTLVLPCVAQMYVRNNGFTMCSIDVHPKTLVLHSLPQMHMQKQWFKLFCNSCTSKSIGCFTACPIDVHPKIMV